MPALHNPFSPKGFAQDVDASSVTVAYATSRHWSGPYDARSWKPRRRTIFVIFVIADRSRHIQRRSWMTHNNPNQRKGTRCNPLARECTVLADYEDKHSSCHPHPSQDLQVPSNRNLSRSCVSIPATCLKLSDDGQLTRR